MKAHESPTLTKVGTVANLTQGQAFQKGQDNLSAVPLLGHLFGGDDYTIPGFGS